MAGAHRSGAGGGPPRSAGRPTASRPTSPNPSPSTRRRRFNERDNRAAQAHAPRTAARQAAVPPRRRGGAGDPVRHQWPRAPDDGGGVRRRLPGIAVPPVRQHGQTERLAMPRPPSRGQGQAELGDLGRERRHLDGRRHGRRVPHRYRHRGSRGRRLHFDVQVRGSRRVPGGDASRQKRPGRLRGGLGRDGLRWHRRCRVDPGRVDARRPRAALVSVRGRGRSTGLPGHRQHVSALERHAGALQPGRHARRRERERFDGLGFDLPERLPGPRRPGVGACGARSPALGPPAEDGGRDGHRCERRRGRRSARDELGERRRRLHRERQAPDHESARDRHLVARGTRGRLWLLAVPCRVHQ